MYSQTLLVDAGGFFPEQDDYQDVAWFLMDVMKLLGTDAVGLGERDLRYGLAYLKGQVKRTGLPVVSSNLMDRRTGKPVFDPYVIRKFGNVKVGIFSLLGDKSALGPAKDSLQVADPAATARTVLAEMRAKGATVTVLLSQLGKVDSEDLVSAVDGVSVVIAGHDVPMEQEGRMIKRTVACYGGEQGQYVCETELTLDPQGRPLRGKAAAVMLGPEIDEKPEVQKLVKSFEDGFNEKLRKEETAKIERLQANRTAQSSPDHFVGADVCVRCHPAEGAQWRTTAHSLAWRTLVEAKKDATPDCIGCHVLGYRQPGGFRSTDMTPGLTNVQCENCHGMGTLHEGFAAASHRITAQVCIVCHHGENDPEFDFDRKMPMIAHGNTSGESIRHLKSRMSGGAAMGGGGHASN